MGRSRLKYGLLAGFLLGMAAGSAAYNLLGYKWPTGAVIDYYINANTDDVTDETAATKSAATSWSQICPANLRLTYGGSTSLTGNSSDGVNIVNWVDEGDNGVLATAYIWYSQDTILETDMVFNDHYDWDTSGVEGNYDVETVALHEFGHWVGLDHNSGIMSPSYSTVERSIDNDAESGFKDMYDCGNDGGDGDDGGGGGSIPSIQLDQSSMTFSGSGEETFKVRNSGEEALTYQVSVDRAWMSASPTSGTSTGEWDDITVTVDASQITGDNTGTITVSAEGADNSPQFISVTVNAFVLTIVSGSGGTTDPSPGTYTYYDTARVTITALPQTNYAFSHWSGDASGSSNPLTVTVNSSKTVKANFIRQYRLTLESEKGGSTDPPPGEYIHDEGTVLLIRAAADANYRFKRWSGDASGVDNPLRVVMSADKTIRANFVRIFKLSLSTGPGGTTDPSPGTHSYEEGTDVQITAKPDVNFRFLNWSGDLSGTDNPVRVNMDADKSIKADFMRIYRLSLRASLGGTTNPPPGDYVYDEGSQVTLQAVPDVFYVFEEWRGDASGQANPLTLTMDADKTALAQFRLIQKPLNFAGQKVLNRSLSQGEYIIVLTWQANPDNVNITNYRIYILQGNDRVLLAELDSGTFLYWHRGVEKDKPYTYALVAVGPEGTEGQPAVLVVQ